MPNLMFTFKQLEAIREVARGGTIVKAAEVLHVTSTALTSRIKILEDDFGLALFDRTGGRRSGGRGRRHAHGRSDRRPLRYSGGILRGCTVGGFASAPSRPPSTLRHG